ncbi:phosphonate ABC transporter ATP-binding protein [Desulfosediminicola sp.]|uniref:phosphonate ABC transporter ATP-binding protein n=1 Tax=Desulfosediminicola sp. TaxID=2886825 RepID=UPI003AF201D3
MTAFMDSYRSPSKPLQTLIELQSEDISYGDVVALKNITIGISQGEKVALIGRSGAGKTTLLKRLYLTNPRLCAFIHQHKALVPQLSVFHNIYMGKLDQHPVLDNIRNLLSPAQKYKSAIEPIACQLGLADKLFARVGELSGGQQQRVGIGRALYRNCPILMADEPVSSLDELQREEIMAAIVDSGKTVITTLHSVELAKRYFQRVIGIKDRSILFDMTVSQLTDRQLAELYS